jgi:hypothetical protein
VTTTIRSQTEIACIFGRRLLAVGLLFIGAGAALADSVIFSDDFNGTTLNPAWQILPGQGSYTVGNGNLRYFNSGSQSATTGWYNPALTLALPFSGTHWEISTKATYNLFYLDSSGVSSGAQAPEVLVKFNPGVTISSNGGPNYAGTDFTRIERDIDAGYGSNVLEANYGSVQDVNMLNPADSTIKNNVGDGTYWYQITRNGGSLTIAYSYDGTNYTNAFTTQLANPTGTYNELLLGGLTWQGVGSYTDYDYVHIMATATPEPNTATLWLAALPLIGAGLLFRRRNQARA